MRKKKNKLEIDSQTLVQIKELLDDKRPVKAMKFTPKMQKKLVVLFLLVLLAFVGLSVRLYLINKQSGQQYKKQVLSHQKYTSNTIPFKRGDIVDSKGTKLAVSEKVYNLVIDVKNMQVNKGKENDYTEYTLSAVKTCFADFDEGAARAYMAAHPDSHYYVALRQLPYEEIAPFLAMQEERITKEERQAGGKDGRDIQGIWFEEEYKRYYPNGSLACDIIGFTGSNNKGFFGLEEYYDDTLNGINGRTYGYLDDEENLNRTTKSAVDGYNIVTTIDANIQSIVERNLAEYEEEYRDNVREGSGAKNLGCIIMEVNTGNILAMADGAPFDLNDNYNTEPLIGRDLLDAEGKKTDMVISQAIAESLEGDQLTMNLNALWRNFCISQTYEPGSVSKPFTVAAGLDSGRLTGEESYYCEGALEVGDYRIRCHNWKAGGDGLLTTKEAVEQSCNVALMLMAQKIGKETYLQYQDSFNFGLKTNIDLAGEARTVNVVYNEKNMLPTELATSSFGQGYNATMIQMITGFCSLINGGYYYEPHMVSKITSSDGSVVQNIEPRILKQTISAETSNVIRDICNGVVTNGTGKTARPVGYAIGGKTGTAEMIPRDKVNYLVSFMGYAPADDPKIAIYVVVDRPNVASQDDAKHATRLVKNILTEVLPYLNIFMTEPVTEEEQAELDERKALVQMPEGGTSENSVSENTVSNNAITAGGLGRMIKPEDLDDPNVYRGEVPEDLSQEGLENMDEAPLTGGILNANTGEGLEEDDEEDSPF